MTSYLAQHPARDLPSDLVERAELVASELVTNACLHAGGRLRLRAEVTISGSVWVVVADKNPTPPRLRRPVIPDLAALDALDDDMVIGGRGLWLVEAHCARWGYQPTRDGKSVWALLRATRREASR